MFLELDAIMSSPMAPEAEIAVFGHGIKYLIKVDLLDVHSRLQSLNILTV
jgi:hypothetical protein